MYSPRVSQTNYYNSSNNNNNDGAVASSSSLASSSVSAQQRAWPPASPTLNQPSTPLSSIPPDGRGRHRKQVELQLLDREIQLLQEELRSLDKLSPASTACKDLVAFIESCPDPFLANSDGVEPESWPYDQPVKASRCCWRF